MINFRWVAVWQRNFLVWRKLLVPSLLGNFGDPLIYLLALGFGFSRFVGTIDGLPYLVFLASGIVCSSAMNAASFEGMFSAYTRMSMQKTWEAMLSAPLSVNDVVFGEMIWAATKGLINATAIFIVASLLGLVSGLQSLWVLPIVFLLSVCFAATALIVTSVAQSYDFFTYYLTLLITPMMLLSGVFFPINQMPAVIQHAAQLLPLYHAVVLVRPLMTNGAVNHIVLHLSVIIFYAALAYSIAAYFAKRRIIN